MDDFFKGYSQGMTGSTGGLPSQSVLEAMGRDAARNQWNNTNTTNTGGQGPHRSAANENSIPLTTVLYEAGLKITLRKLLIHFGIAVGLSFVSMAMFMLMPRSLNWLADLTGILGYLLLFWVFLRTPFFLISRLVRALKTDKATPGA